MVTRREEPVLRAKTSGAEKKLLCTVSGKTATSRRLVSRIRLRHAMVAGLFHPPHPNIQSLAWPLLPRAGTAAPRTGPRPNQRLEVTKQSELRRRILAYAARLSLLHPPRALQPGHSRALGPLAGLSRRRPPERPSPTKPSDPAADPNPDRAALPRREGSAIFTASLESHEGDLKPPTYRPTAPEEPSAAEQNRRSLKVSAALGSPDTTIAIKPKPETPPHPGHPDALACGLKISKFLIGSNRKHRLELNFLCIRRVLSHSCSRFFPQTFPQNWVQRSFCA